MAVALLPLDARASRPCTAIACALDGPALTALERTLHGRPRDPSRGGEAWLGPSRSVRAARLAGTPAHALGAEVAARVVAAGLAGAVAASVEDVRDAVAQGTRRVVLLGPPCRVHALRQAEPIPGLEAAFVIGTGPVVGGRDAVNALADLAILDGGTPDAWAVVRNAHGRAMLDVLGADLSLDAIGPTAFAAAAATLDPMRAP